MRAFRFSFDAAQCLNCGVCVDVCPVHCLDMTRPQAPGPEGTFARSATPAGTQDWMMVFPVQVSPCTGCMVCAMECPADIISVARVDEPVPFAPPQGPLVPEPAYDPAHWQALSAFTRMSRKHRPLGDPWGPEHKWRPVRRIANWRVWRTWRTNEDFERATGTAQTDAAVHDEGSRRQP
jgi:Pyruvate/2-oxoacid:ferredoxin oxidoreductase delta subunit